MDIQADAALDYSSSINKGNNLYKSKVSSSDFENTLNVAEQKIEKTGAFVSAKQSLQDTYPDLKYHVLDASQFTYWNRLDFPVSKLFEDNIDVETLKSWKPKNPTATGYEPSVQSDLEKLPRGAHVVIIHPSTQQRMDKDPEYAKQIADKIEKHFVNEIRINQAIDPESIKSMSQVVTITEDGEIGLKASVCDGPSKTISDSDKTSVKKEGKVQPLVHKLQNRPLSFPPREITTVSLEYDYRYRDAYIQKKKSKTDYYI